MILKGGKATTKPKSYDGKLDTILLFKKKKKSLDSITIANIPAA